MLSSPSPRHSPDTPTCDMNTNACEPHRKHCRHLMLCSRSLRRDVRPLIIILTPGDPIWSKGFYSVPGLLCSCPSRFTTRCQDVKKGLEHVTCVQRGWRCGAFMRSHSAPSRLLCSLLVPRRELLTLLFSSTGSFPFVASIYLPVLVQGNSAPPRSPSVLWFAHSVITEAARSSLCLCETQRERKDSSTR